MVPINSETPKGLLTVRGEVLIERLICQLRAAGVNKIRVVVGFMKEAFEYLIDDFNVELLVNPEYHQRNNLHSLALAEAYLYSALRYLVRGESVFPRGDAVVVHGQHTQESKKHGSRGSKRKTGQDGGTRRRQ